MVTSRGYLWLVSLAGLVLLGVLLGREVSLLPTWSGMTLLVLWGGRCLYFAVRAEGLRRRIQVHCRLFQAGREAPVLWAQIPFTVELTVFNPCRYPVLLVLEDWFAPGTEVVAGTYRCVLRVKAGQNVTWRYQRRAAVTGCVRRECLQVIVLDSLGMFQQRWRVGEPQQWWVLPPLCDEEGRQRAVKQFNQVPPPGSHRWRRPGTGSELLDLRDYQPGDPPKMVAWKVSARREQLITRELESDVPVRCLLFVDGAADVRLGSPGQRPVQRLAQAAGLLAQTAIAQRDPVGLVCFDAQGAEVLPPARTRQHLLRVLRRLAEVAAYPAVPRGLGATALTRRVWPWAHFLYPHLVQGSLNNMPSARLWRPLLDRSWGWFIPAVMLANLVMVFTVPPWRLWAAEQAAAFSRWCLPQGGISQLILFAFSMITFLIGPLLVAGLVWLWYGTQDLFGSMRRSLTQRKQLAALVAFNERAGPARIEHLLADNTAYTHTLGCFLQQHLIPTPVHWYDWPQRQLYREPAKIEVLASALLRAVSRARDNELYVILADLADYTPHLLPLVTACRLAHARHHQVLVILPEPQGSSHPPSPFSSGTAQVSELPSLATSSPSPPESASDEQKLARRYYATVYQQLRRQLVAVGASVLCLEATNPLPVLLERLDRLRGYRSRR